jgi:hypothetical protein
VGTTATPTGSEHFATSSGSSYAWSIWLLTGTPAKGGNDAFLRLGRDLEKAGMSPAEIDMTLWQEASLGRYPSGRRAQIKHIMWPLTGSSYRLAA